MYLRTAIAPDLDLLVYARYSTDEQRRQSIADQNEYCLEFLREYGVRPRSAELISDEGVSGELRSRPGIDRVRAGVRRRLWGLIVAEDSSRVFRGVAPCLDFVGEAVDRGIRLIFVNDGVDTADEDWPQRLEEAQRHHGQANTYTRFRIKRAHEGLWRMGAAIGLLRPGYRRYALRPDDEKSPKFDELDPRWTPVIVRAFEMVANGSPLDAVARHLTGAGLPKFRNAPGGAWADRNVLALIRCEAYRGVELYRETVSRKEFSTGRSKPVRNPDPGRVLRRDVPHLRVVKDWVWHAANDAIDRRARPGGSPSGPDHPLYGIPRDSRTLLSNVFVCGVCGEKMHAEGRNEGGYRCRAARRGGCWNKATCLRALTHAGIVGAVSEAVLSATPGAVESLAGHVESRLADRGRLREEREALRRRRSELAVQQRRLVDAIRTADSPPAWLAAAVAEMDVEDRRLHLDGQRLEAQLAEGRAVPGRAEIEERIRQVAATVVLGDEEARPLLRQLLDGPVRAVPYQPFGNANVVLRAEFTLRLTRLLPDDVCLMLGGAGAPADWEELLVPLSVDLFVPSKPQANARRALAYHRDNGERPTLEEIGRHLGISKRTAHLALQLGKRLEAAGVEDPFVRLTECPANPSRWRFKDAS